MQGWVARVLSLLFPLTTTAIDGSTGYILTATVPSSTVFSLPEKLPLEEQQIFDSFELLQHSNNSSIINSSPSLTTASSSPAELQ
jgi:hypothetical protein